MKNWLKKGVIALILSVVVGVGTAFTTQAYTNYNAVTEVAIVNAKSSSADIKLVQKKLKNWGYYKGAVDGIYGKQTKSAVILFQKRNGLVADGIVGNKTLKAMGISSSQ